MDITRSDPLSAPIGTVVLLHGFTRSPRDLAALSGRCVDLGAGTLRPALGSLWWPTSTNNAHHLDGVVGALRPDVVGPLVVVGHSAGASAGAWIGAGLRETGADLRGVVMVDGVESPTGLIRRAWPRLDGVRVRAVCAPPSRCNRHGALAAWLGQQHGDVEVVTIADMGHGDIEGTPGGIYRWACGDDPARPAAAAVMEAVLARVQALLREGDATTRGR